MRGFVWLLVLLGMLLAPACGDEAVECAAGQQPIDVDGDEVPERCADVVDSGAEGDPCSIDHPCARGLSCFFVDCAGHDCALDVGTCSPDAA